MVPRVPRFWCRVLCGVVVVLMQHSALPAQAVWRDPSPHQVKFVTPAKIVELAGASLYMFLSNEADVIRELTTFATSLPAGRGARVMR
ncbi:MAG TPA: hypothetical protein VEA16_11935 [Vicinamibacterales bacterium]|nr:hypothetical protein [Vicinamibacterales bacterium]